MRSSSKTIDDHWTDAPYMYIQEIRTKYFAHKQWGSWNAQAGRHGAHTNVFWSHPSLVLNIERHLFMRMRNVQMNIR